MIKYFKTEDDFRDFLNKFYLTEIGFGTEGVAYFDMRNDRVIKTLDDKMYNPEKLITEDDIKLDSFKFPKDLYVCNDELLGYSSSYFRGDLFNDNTYGRYKRIDLIKLLNASKVMLKDINSLTDNHIYSYDLYSNMMFDGNVLAACDTLNYYRDYSDDLDEKNLSNYIYSLNYELSIRLTDYNYDFNSSFEDNVNDYMKKRGTSKVLIR